MGSQTVKHHWVTNTIHTHTLANKTLKKKKNCEGIISPYSRLIFIQLTVIKTVGLFVVVVCFDKHISTLTVSQVI